MAKSHSKKLSRATIEIFLGIFLSIVSLLAFIYFAHEIAEKQFVELDNTISLFTYSLRTPVLTDIMMLITRLGGSMTFILASLVLIVLLIRKHQKEALIFCLVLILGLVLNNLFKLFFQIPRPDISPLIVERTYSFPSGHAMNAFIFYSLVAYFSYHFFKNRILSLAICLIATTLILLIGFSRIYLGVHHATDVVAGLIAGFWLVVTVLLVEYVLIYRKLYKKSE